MSNYNKVILMGRLTKDPELKYTPSGTAVAGLRLAVTNRIKQGDEWKEEPCYVDVSVFGRRGETCAEYLNKGSLVLVDGRLRFSEWQTDDGQRKSKLDVSARDVISMPKGMSSTGEGRSPSANSIPDTDSDVPF